MTRPLTAAEVDELVGADAAELLDEATAPAPAPAPKLTGTKAPAPRRKPPEPAPDPVKAPHGWVYREGQWRPRKPAGRPAGKPAAKGPGRVTATPAAPAAGSQAAKASAATLGRAAAELAEGIGFVMAAAPMPASTLRVRVRLQASILTEHAGAIGQAAAVAAPHVPMVERFLSKLAAGSGGMWILPFTLALGPVLIASAEAWRAPVDDTMIEAAEQIEQSALNQIKVMFKAMAEASATAAAEANIAHDLGLD